MLFDILSIFASYLVGSIPFGFLIAWSRGIDLRAAGSGNIGATNVGRLLGKKIGVLVFLLDFAKGAGPVAVARWASTDEWVAVAAGLATVLGHIFPVWLRFRGGKGVATGAGVVAVLLPVPTLGAAIVWLLFLCSTRYVSLASIAAAVALFGLHLLVEPEPLAPGTRILTGFCLLAVALVVLRHFGNIARLVQNRESQIPESVAMNTLTRVIHVLAMGSWFGGGAIFSFLVAVQLFAKLDAGSTPPGERPEWLTLPATFDKAAGTRLAGEIISPMFARYFGVQGACGFLALVTALGFVRTEPGRRVHRIRFWLIAVALLTVVAGWPLNQHVGELRILRNQGDDAARASFGSWHGASLLLNMAVIGLVALAMAMAAVLPNSPQNRKCQKIEASHEPV
jgi:glycerol-3-phosphate acyltransferase PlsY